MDTVFSVNKSVLSNLDRLSREYSIVSEQRLLELYDVALPMVDYSLELFTDGLDIYEILAIISEGLDLGDYPTSDANSDAHKEFLRRGNISLSRVDKAFLTEIYTREMALRGRSVREVDFLPTSLFDETFTYVRNSLSDEAYDVFSQDFKDPRVTYSATFRDVARSVSIGDVTYGLFPLEEKGGARLPTVSEIIFRNDFKINSVIPVFGPDGNADMKYALVSRSFTVPQRETDDDVYLEIRLDDEASLSELLFSVEHFGMSVYRVNTVTFDTEGESDTYFSVVIRDGGNGFDRLLTYLTLFLRDFVPVGIYKNLE